jgi:hypothetical protein
MSKWLIYNETGVFTGVSIDCPTEHLDQNVPEGCGCIMGAFDTLSQRVDTETGLVVDYQPPSPSLNHEWDTVTKRWKYVMPLADAKAAAIAKTYPDVDAVYDASIGRRTTEYTRAEEAARAYKAADFTGLVSDYISGHARSNPTGTEQTNGWAAQQIIERADTFHWAELQMRNVRFDRQADMRAAATHDELRMAIAAWDGFIADLRAQLGL